MLKSIMQSPFILIQCTKLLLSPQIEWLLRLVSWISPPSSFLSLRLHTLPKLAFFVKYTASYMGCNAHFKINQNQLEIPVAMKVENMNSAYSMSFTCNEIKNVIHSVY